MSVTIDDSIELVPISLDYLNDIHESFDQQIIEFLPLESVSSEKETTAGFIRHSIDQRDTGTDLVWVILFQKQFAGCCGIHTIHSRQPHFGLWVKKEQQQKGIGRRVVQHMLRWGIEKLDVEFIKYPVDERNTRSLHLLKGLNLELADYYETGEGKRLKIREYRLYKKKTRRHQMLIERWYHEMWNEWDKTIIPEIVQADLYFRGSLGKEHYGYQGLSDYIDYIRKAFPDFHNTIELMIAEDDKTFAKLKYSGTHQGDVFGIPRTSRHIAYWGSAIFQFKNEKIQEVWVLGDIHGLLEQLR